MPNITNNRRSTRTIGVKSALISVIFPLLFVGMLVTAAGMSPQSPRGTGNYSAEDQRTIPTLAENITNNSFWASLRFWERNRSQPPARQPASREQNAQPRETPAQSAGTPTRNSGTQNSGTGRSNSLAMQRPATSGLAPVPPQIPHVDHRPSPGNAPLPEWSGNFEHDTNNGGAHHSTHHITRPSTSSHLSYSFDARDWVELFPVQQVQPAQQEVREITAPVMVQTTSLHLPTPSALVPLPSEGGHNDWDGQATQLETIASLRNEINKLQQDQTAQTFVLPAVPPVPPAAASVAAPIMPAPTEELQIDAELQIDLSPSYQRRLPHVQTCGVVVVQANFPLTEIASVLDEIKMLQHDLTRYIGVPAAKEKIELCLFKDEQSYIDFLQDFFPRAPRDRRALYIKLDNKPGTLMVQKSKNFEVDLRHEMTHAIIHASIARVPIWLDEGLAKYFEVPSQERANNHPYMSQIRNNARLGMVPSLDRLARLETIDDMGVREYRDSWAWTHFLIHRSPETHRLLAAYLQMLAEYPDKGRAAQTGSAFSLAEGRFAGMSIGRNRTATIPSLKPYLDDIMSNQREAFREHFGAMEP